jgi:hypothetical protein
MTARHPIGELCVLRYPDEADWIVCICHGPTGQRETLGKFADLASASDWALIERDKRLAQGIPCNVHFPDDCPCCGKLAGLKQV